MGKVFFRFINSSSILLFLSSEIYSSEKPAAMARAISAVGCFLQRDGGKGRKRSKRGCTPRYRVGDFQDKKRRTVYEQRQFNLWPAERVEARGKDIYSR